MVPYLLKHQHFSKISQSNILMKTSKFIAFLFFGVFVITNIITAQTEDTKDLYLWLEDVESKKSLDWVRAQNSITEQKIGNHPLYTTLETKFLAANNDKDRIIYPTIVGNYIYNLWQDEINERGLWRRMLKDDFIAQKTEWEIVLDIDDLSKKENKKWVFDGATWLSPNNNICLLALSEGGTDKNSIREFNVKTKEFVKDGFYFPKSKGGVSWLNENKVLMTRDFGEGTLTTSGYPRTVRTLERGQKIEDGKLIFETNSNNVGVFASSFYQNNKWHAYIYDAITFYSSELQYLTDDSFKKLTYPMDAELAGFHKGQILLSLQSDWKINNKTFKEGSLISLDLDKNLKGQQDIKTVYLPNKNSSYVSLTSTKDFIVVNSMENVKNKLIKFSLNNRNWISEAIMAPDFGSIYLISSDVTSNDYFFLYSNFLSPRTLYYANESSLKVVKKLKNMFDSSNLEVKQNTVVSKDGTIVPYFIVHKKDIVLNGNNPTLIYAYGGFNVSEQPDYSFTTGIGWLEQGGVYVLANIRGGGEFGPSWHENGMKEKKQNCYDDFYAVSEYLIESKVTSPKSLGAYGWSNGGLMAGVLFTQRPDLFSAVIVGAPLLDMKRYSKLLAGASWIGEYGNPDIPEEWAYIKKYSPYHNLHLDKEYPEVFFVTSTKDDRVHPGHARKMAAKMKTMGHPFLYHETIEGGHGAASTNAQEARVSALMFTYLNIKLNK